VVHNRKDSRYSEKDAARIVRQMLNVAARCHLNGVVHRDMKPENFLFKSPKEDSPLKATDFGLSDYIRPGRGPSCFLWNRVAPPITFCNFWEPSGLLSSVNTGYPFRF
jgi:serine/threonine protein kinase